MEEREPEGEEKNLTSKDAAGTGEAGLDTFALLALEQTEGRRAHLARQRAEFREMRAREEEGSRRRMAALEAEAAAYQQELERRLVRQQASEKRMLLLAMVTVAVFILIVIGYAIASLL